MKKIMIFAAVLAIAMTVALNFGLVWLFIGVGICFLGEYCCFAAYEAEYTLADYDQKKKNSRKMLLMHAAWYICTLLCAAALGLLNGYDYEVETAVGNYNFIYDTVHQSGNAWYVLFVMLAARGIEQLLIENDIKKNIELLMSRKAPEAV